MRFAPFYGLGAAMGWSPAAVDAASLWQFRAAMVGFAASRGAETIDLSADDVADLSSLLDEAS